MADERPGGATDNPASKVRTPVPNEQGVSSLDVESVECSPEGERVVVHVRGRWHGRRRGSEAAAILIVEDGGRSYRFPAVAQPRGPRLIRTGAWSGSFAIPSWLQPHLVGGTSLAIGEVKTPISAAMIAAAATTNPAPANGVAEPEGDGANRTARPVRAPAGIAGGAGYPSGPERADEAQATPAEGEGSTVSALRAELQARAAAEGRLRGQHADAQAKVKAGAANQLQLEAAHAEMRREFDQVRELVELERTQRAEIESKAVVLAAQVAEIQARVAELAASRDRALRERDRLARQLAEASAQIAVSAASREAAIGEVLGLRAELERLGAELAVAREEAGASTGNLGEAEALLAEARALNASIRARQQGDGSAPAAGTQPAPDPSD